MSVRALLDVNVLVALLDRDHQHHGTARAWVECQSEFAWASCAITQNGFVRITTQPSYPTPDVIPEALRRLDQTCRATSHEFWPCDVSLLDDCVDRTRLLGPKQVTDVYLLALAVAHGGRLATFDRGLPVSAVAGATTAQLVVL